MHNAPVGTYYTHMNCSWCCCCCCCSSPHTGPPSPPVARVPVAHLMFVNFLSSSACWSTVGRQPPLLNLEPHCPCPLSALLLLVPVTVLSQLMLPCCCCPLSLSALVRSFGRSAGWLTGRSVGCPDPGNSSIYRKFRGTQ